MDTTDRIDIAGSRGHACIMVNKEVLGTMKSAGSPPMDSFDISGHN